MTVKQLTDTLLLLMVERGDIGNMEVRAEFLSEGRWTRAPILAADLKESQHDARDIAVVCLVDSSQHVTV